MAEAQAVFRAALRDCQGRSPQARMETKSRTYSVGRVDLVFTPKVAMYWLTWALLRSKLLAFASEYGYPQFDFAILAPGSDQLLGSGQLRTKSGSNRPPPDPFYMQLSQGVVRFSNYGPAVDIINTLSVITDATINYLRQSDPTGIIDAGALVYLEGSVTLTLGPGPLMTWGQWMEVVSLIKRFLDSYEYVRFDFSIMSGQEEIGSGNLKSSDN